MARFKNTITNVVVDVADEKSDRFGPPWEADGGAEKPAKRVTKRAAKTDDDKQ